MPAKKGCWMVTVSDQEWFGLFVNFALTLHDICEKKGTEYQLETNEMV